MLVLLLIILFIGAAIFLWPILSRASRYSRATPHIISNPYRPIKRRARVAPEEPPPAAVPAPEKTYDDVPFVRLHRRLSEDYMLSPAEQTELFALLQANPYFSTLDTLRNFSRNPAVSDLKRVFMTIYIIENTVIEHEKIYLRRYLDGLSSSSHEQEVRVNIRDYLVRTSPRVIEPTLTREFLNQQERLILFFELQRDSPRNQRAVIYDRTENVHNKEVNSSVITAARRLIDTYSAEQPDLSRAQFRPYWTDEVKFARAHNRIMVSDESQYGYERPFTLKDVFAAVLSFVGSRPPDERAEILRILTAEMERKHNKCGTGYLSGLVSSIQGFQADYTITIGAANEIFARISKFIETEMHKEGKEELVDDPEQFVEYVRGKKDELWREVAAEYKDVLPLNEIEREFQVAYDRYIK